MRETKMHLLYNEQPPRSIDPNHYEFSDEDLVWQMSTLPLGNGQFGASVYGYTDIDRIQITENSFANPYKRPQIVNNRLRAGLTGFANIYLDFGHSDVKNYSRELSLDDAVCRVKYDCLGTHYEREYFTSYPDKILAIRIRTDRCGALSFSAFVDIPYIDNYCQVPDDGLARFGKVTAFEGDITAESLLDYYGVCGYGKLRVIAKGGKRRTEGTRVEISDADEALLIFSVGTNYKMESRVFTEEDPKKKISCYPHPKDHIDSVIDIAEKTGFSQLLENHLRDYKALYDRCSIDLGYTAEDMKKNTVQLVREAKSSTPSTYLEGLLFAFGRYLLIASSRVGCLPSNLQGVWSNYRSSPWSAGYWHNINVQMNYWGACLTNLAECFLSYSDYNQAYMAKAKTLADEYIKTNYPNNYSTPAENGWIIGTGGWPYTIDGASGHSGPGTGAFTSLLFWDYYDFTRDKKYLEKVAYPVLRDMSVFFSKTLALIDGKYLVEHSASPEQCDKDGSYHQTVGCAFDQQMVYENYKRTLEAAQILGIDEPLLEVIREQIDKLDPVLIGKSGQVKEFREEEYYGDIGQYAHRHVSHLVGLYPGTLINSNTHEFIEAAKITLRERGLGSSGWSIAHRLCLQARVKESDICLKLVEKLIRDCIPENLWDQHPPFQIDGNFGFMTGVGEMLLQSQSGYIELLPALPKKWANGSFRGLKARGNFTVDCSFKKSKPIYVRIISESGGEMKLKCENLVTAEIIHNGKKISSNESTICIDTAEGDEITIKF